VSIAQVLSEEVERKGTLRTIAEKEGEKAVSKFRYYRQSPFYNTLRKVAETLEVLLAVVEYLKTDRRGRFELTHLQQLYLLLRYYLMVPLAQLRIGAS
jgi:hypothetical protein